MPCTPSNRFSTPPGEGGRLPTFGVSQPDHVAPPDPQQGPGNAKNPFRGGGSQGRPRPRDHVEIASERGPRAHPLGLERQQLDREGGHRRHQGRQARHNSIDASGAPFAATTACGPRQKHCCEWCGTAGVSRAGTGSAIPSSRKMPITPGATVPVHRSVSGRQP